ncbi:MAG TPA: hypothetical protein VF389_11805 [Woeseiaceae bacterium]
MESVFDKFGGIRPMAEKVGNLPPSTVKSWNDKRQIPEWRHDAILAAAQDHGFNLSREELINIRPDVGEWRRAAA